MSLTTSESENQRKLQELYGLAFPEELLQFCSFLQNESGLKEAISLSPTGALGVAMMDAANVEAKLPLALHWRFYRDPPEFFTILHGDCDGEHWGLLLDEPEKGFRGVAAYYNNDGDLIRTYANITEVIRTRIQSQREGCLENAEYDPDHKEQYQRDIESINGFESRFEEFVQSRNLDDTDRRPCGVRSDTGLDVIGPETHWNGMNRLGDAPLPSEDVVSQRVANATDDPTAALLLGRSLWYWQGERASDAAFRLLTAAYRALDRQELASIAEVHHQHRDLKSVDLLSERPD